MLKSLINLTTHQFLVFSPREGESDDAAAFWSNKDGWVNLISATLFTEEDKRTLSLPIGDGVCWLQSSTAARRCMIASVMDTLQADGFDVIPGPTGGWSWASANSSAGPDDSAFPSQGAAWKALATAQQQTVAAAGLSIHGLFGGESDQFVEPLYMVREIDSPLWTTEGVREDDLDDIMLLSLEGALAQAQEYLDDSEAAVLHGQMLDAPSVEDIEFVSDVGQVITMLEAIELFPAFQVSAKASAPLILEHENMEVIISEPFYANDNCEFIDVRTYVTLPGRGAWSFDLSYDKRTGEVIDDDARFDADSELGDGHVLPSIEVSTAYASARGKAVALMESLIPRTGLPADESECETEVGPSV